MAVRLSDYLKKTYGEKVYRLSLSSGCTCPNRDGSIILPSGERLTSGCTFCSEGGSGEFAAGSLAVSASRGHISASDTSGKYPASDMQGYLPDISTQIEEAKALIREKTDASKFIAYFQSFTNTYGDVERLMEIYKKAIEQSDIVALSLGTRPDCLRPEVMDMLTELNAIKPVWVELGLQTIHESTADFIKRGYDLSVFEDAFCKLKEAGIIVIVHVIFGLPGERRDDMLETVRFLSRLNPTLDGIKIQNLQILKGSVMYRQYRDMFEDGAEPSMGKERPDLHIFSLEEYTDLVAEAIALLPQNTVVHRMTGDGPRRLLVEPLWSLDKKRVLNTLTKKTKGLFTE